MWTNKLWIVSYEICIIKAPTSFGMVWFWILDLEFFFFQDAVQNTGCASHWPRDCARKRGYEQTMEAVRVPYRYARSSRRGGPPKKINQSCVARERNPFSNWYLRPRSARGLSTVHRYSHAPTYCTKEGMRALVRAVAAERIQSCTETHQFGTSERAVGKQWTKNIFLKKVPINFITSHITIPCLMSAP